MQGFRGRFEPTVRTLQRLVEGLAKGVHTVMNDQMIENLKKNEEILGRLSDEQVGYLALSELMSEMAFGKDVPPGLKIKRISLSAELTKRAGVKW